MAPRSTSRRNTPISPAKSVISKPTTRSTRAAQVLQNQGPDGRAASPELLSHRSSNVESAGDATRLTRQKGKSKDVGGLSIVEEAQAEVEYPTIASSGEEDGREGELEGIDGVSIGSSFNATAQTTYSEIALEDLDQDAMIDALVSLYQAADSLLKFLNVQDPQKAEQLRRDLLIPGSRNYKRLQRFYNTLKLQKSHFGDKNYIELEIAVRGLLQVRHWSEVGEGDWRPDNIVILANVAKLAYDLFPSSRENREAKVTLELLWDSFPKNFLTDLSEATSELGGSTLVPETFQFALESRIQYAIATLIDYNGSDPDGFDPDDISTQIFFVGKDKLRGFQVNGLATEDGTLPKQYEKAVLRALRKIRGHFSEEEPFVDFQGLNRDFPWSRFLEISDQWIQKRAIELKDKITAQGGSEKIQERLQNEIERRNTVHNLDDDEAAYVNTAPVQRASHGSMKPLPAVQVTRQSSKGVSASPLDVLKMRNAKIVEVKRLRKNADGVVSSSGLPNSSAAPAPTQSATEISTGTPFDVPPSAQPDPQPQSNDFSHDLSKEMRADRAQQNKENNPPLKKPAFLDRQANATREPDFSEEEGEFRTDKRNVDIGRKRKENPLQPSPRKRVRGRGHETEDGEEDVINAIGDDEIDDAEYQPSSVSVQDAPAAYNHATSSSHRQPQMSRRQPRSTVSPLLSSQPPLSSRNTPSLSSTPIELTPSQRVAAINEQAKVIRAKKNSSVNKAPQRRRPWTQAEIDRLMDLISQYGCKWSLIKQMDLGHPEGSVLEGRDQVALKDKARNIKHDFIQYNKNATQAMPFPPNFEKVTTYKAKQ